LQSDCLEDEWRRDDNIKTDLNMLRSDGKKSY
jgi:hypothetical protein